MTVPIKINNVQGAQHLIDWAVNQDFDIYLSTGANVMINAKSFLGVCALVGQEVDIVVADHIPSEQFTKALEALMSK